MADEVSESPSVNKIWEGVQGLLNGGHPNVPSLLRRIAKSVEQQNQKSSNVIPFPKSPD